ncbi:MAG: hypothetical protein H0X17_02720 [Deltaproteobacteria bacterium]|nr:hypothetical protein [Deltaproteobacteria bacterium]
MNHLVRLAPSLSLLLVAAACGDNLTGSGVTPDATPTTDAAPDAPPFVKPAAVAVPLSTAGTDELLGVTAGPNGSFYAVGFRSATHEATSDRELVLVKLTGAGALDTTFGDGDGIANLNVQVGTNGEVWRGIVVQPGGKIVVLGTVEDEVNPLDRDAALVRFDATGAVDTTFGTAGTGIVRLELNVGLVNGTMVFTGADAPWGLAVNADGKLYIHAAQRTELLNGGLPRADTDYAVVRLTADGTMDTGFATGGKYTLDILGSVANVRGINVLADGSVVANGYSSSSATGDTVQPVVFKLDTAGAPVTAFAEQGLFHDVVMQSFTEVYGIAVQPDGKLVTAGYGRNASADTNDYVSIRFTAAGAIDTSWGTGGKFVYDPTGTNIADNNRHVIALPGNRTALIGSSGVASTTSDAVVAVLTSSGALDTAFGTGLLSYELGSNDAFWGGAVSADASKAIFVGFKGGGATPSATSNDDSHVMILPMP